MRSVENCTARFKRFLETYSSKSSDSQIVKFKITSHHTWDEVKADIEKAVRSHDRKGNFWHKNLVHTGAKSASNSIPAIKAWLDILPDGEYTSIICGALKLVYGVCLISCHLLVGLMVKGNTGS